MEKKVQKAQKQTMDKESEKNWRSTIQRVKYIMFRLQVASPCVNVGCYIYSDNVNENMSTPFLELYVIPRDYQLVLSVFIQIDFVYS